jgi:hypothetical protein
LLAYSPPLLAVSQKLSPCCPRFLPLPPLSHYSFRPLHSSLWRLSLANSPTQSLVSSLITRLLCHTLSHSVTLCHTLSHSVTLCHTLSHLSCHISIMTLSYLSHLLLRSCHILQALCFVTLVTLLSHLLFTLVTLLVYTSCLHLSHFVYISCHDLLHLLHLCYTCLHFCYISCLHLLLRLPVKTSVTLTTLCHTVTLTRLLVYISITASTCHTLNTLVTLVILVIISCYTCYTTHW